MSILSWISGTVLGEGDKFDNTINVQGCVQGKLNYLQNTRRGIRAWIIIVTTIPTLPKQPILPTDNWHSKKSSQGGPQLCWRTKLTPLRIATRDIPLLTKGNQYRFFPLIPDVEYPSLNNTKYPYHNIEKVTLSYFGG